MEVIKSITNCPTCGAECNIEGSDERTHFYVPKIKTAMEILLKHYGQPDSAAETMNILIAMREYAEQFKIK